ncbi:MAG: adenylate/guanylate cyclase domain-containing protein [Intrasporangium sp.]|uniref:adenylate/guanylate cyclase domain-containing protein n=1 Tax=Intrasporangium sp. TaxID=1925024 RepID=UPI00264A1B9F|nr:adenylate/guanylate cyclase domain-containing protein [Intrasporangium sp.]MDN5794446.1 adenylate/guanylate cyclase domain-containing protein [Intrasporangium sp.]
MTEPDRPEPDYPEVLLGRPRTLRGRDVSRGAEVSLVSARKFWHALGFPVVAGDDVMFTEADREALASLTGLVRDGALDEPTALSLARAFARSADRLAGWQSQLIAEAVEDELTAGRAADTDQTFRLPTLDAATETARRIVDLSDRLEPLLVYAWRRHLSATVARMIADAEPEEYGTTKVRSVGFADLVNFSALVRKMSERELARLVQRFEALSADVITAHDGRLVKTVGDEVLFTAAPAAPAAAIALDLVDAIQEDDLLPDVRVGVARGPVVSRMGDIFGTTVNRASRLTAAAPAGTVLVDGPTARELAELSGFELHGRRRRVLRGVGTVTPSVLRRASSGGRRPG